MPIPGTLWNTMDPVCIIADQKQIWCTYIFLVCCLLHMLLVGHQEEYPACKKIE